MQATTIKLQDVLEAVKKLSESERAQLEALLNALKSDTHSELPTPITIKDVQKLWSGVQISDKDFQEARAEMMKTTQGNAADTIETGSHDVSLSEFWEG